MNHSLRRALEWAALTRSGRLTTLGVGTALFLACPPFWLGVVGGAVIWDKYTAHKNR